MKLTRSLLALAVSFSLILPALFSAKKTSCKPSGFAI